MPIRLFIADTEKAHIQSIIRSVSHCSDIRVIGTGGNGAHALRQLAVTPADMLITEVQLPGLDGIMLLRDLQSLRHPPAAIVCTRFYSPVCVSRAWNCGASYFLYKPLDYNRLPEIIRECHRARLRDLSDARFEPSVPKPRSRSEIVRALLSEMGMPANLTGSMYLTEALSAACEDPALIKNLSKGLYAEVAVRTRSTPARVERSLRNAIAIACERGGLARRFGHSPTNREFVMYLLEQLDQRLSSRA